MGKKHQKEPVALRFSAFYREQGKALEAENKLTDADRTSDPRRKRQLNIYWNVYPPGLQYFI
jgi:hypothetical protein